MPGTGHAAKTELQYCEKQDTVPCIKWDSQTETSCISCYTAVKFLGFFVNSTLVIQYN